MGKGLAKRLAGKTDLILASRDSAAASAFAATLPGGVTVLDQNTAIARADIVVVALPYAAALDFVRSTDLSGKVVVDISNPLKPDFSGLTIGYSTSAAEELQAAAAGAKTAVDNTFLSPALQQPITLGADFVIHSTTKYLNGHSDVVGGAVVSADRNDGEYFRNWANITGVTASPFDCYLTLRGLRTLFPRVERQQQNAEAVAAFLSRHPHVSAVHYPGLASHPGHDVARSQQNGSGAMLSFEIAGGREAVKRFVESVQVFTLAESLGGVESLVAHPATMTHAGMGEEARKAAGISNALLRLSVGLESEKDLIEDLAQALGNIEEARAPVQSAGLATV